METRDFNESQLPARPVLSPREIVGCVLLVSLTVFLTWRASILERTLQQEDEQPAMVGRLAPDFSAITLDGRLAHVL